MNRGDWRMTVEVLQYGQPRPFADSIYTYRVTFEIVPYFTNQPMEFSICSWSKDVVKSKLKAVKYWEDEPDNAFEPYLKEIKQISTGVWEFTVIERFTD